MDIAPLLSPMGQPVLRMGGSTAWRIELDKGFVISFEWTRRGRKTYRCIVLWKDAGGVQGKVENGAWCITHVAMLDFLDFDRDGRCTGRPSNDLFREAKEALPSLGFDKNDRHALFALLDVVLKHGPMLAKMPAAPLSVRRTLVGEAMWDITASKKTDGKIIDESSV